MRSDHSGVDIAINHIKRMIKNHYATLEEFSQAVIELKKVKKKKPA
jgi:hypothetical protein